MTSRPADETGEEPEHLVLAGEDGRDEARLWICSPPCFGLGPGGWGALVLGAQLLMGDQTAFTGDRRYLVYRWFTEPAVRATHPPEQHERHARELVADLRSAVGRHSGAVPADALRAIGTAVTDSLTAPEFRGCAFLKAAAEYPDPDDRVRQVILDHRAWYIATLTELFTQVFGDSPRQGKPEHAARHFVLMRDGAMSGAHLDGADSVGDAFRCGVEGLLTLLH